MVCCALGPQSPQDPRASCRSAAHRGSTLKIHQRLAPKVAWKPTCHVPPAAKLIDEQHAGMLPIPLNMQKKSHTSEMQCEPLERHSVQNGARNTCR